MNSEQITAAVERGHMLLPEAETLENAGRMTKITVEYNGERELPWARLLIPDDRELDEGEDVYGYLCNDLLLSPGRSWGIVLKLGTRGTKDDVTQLDDAFFEAVKRNTKHFEEHFKKGYDDKNNS